MNSDALCGPAGSPSPLPPARSSRLVEHALLLIGRMHKARSETAQAARQELARWREADPAHAAAAEAAQALWDGTDGSSLRDSVPLPRSHADTQRTRRRVAGLLGVAGLVAAIAGGGRWYWQQPVYSLALHTDQAQMLARTLPDGTQLDLAARTTATVTYYRDRREVRLDAGEVRFEVRHDADKPFSVHTGWGRVRVLGTTFSVTARDGQMRVAVAEGRVAVWPASAGADGPPPMVLGAGEAVQTESRGTGIGLGARGTVQASDVGAWRQGWLVFDNTRLPEAIDRWNDYLRQPLRLGESPSLQTLRLSGSFPLRDPQSFLDGLPDILPVRVVRAPGDATAVIERR